MSVIKTQKINKKEESTEDTLARFCYYFPQYQYHEAKILPNVRIRKLLRVAEKEKAKMMYDLTIAISAPHTKKGGGVKKMLDNLKKIIDQ